MALTRQIEREMNQASKARDFESAALLRNQLLALRELGRQVLFSDRELQDVNRDEALVQLANLLQLAKPPRRIEGFDISHMQGSDTVASMVVFASGVPDKTAYRKFKMRLPGNDDFAHMAEALTRRFSEDNRKKWGRPDLVLIDGGKGQLSSAIKVRDQIGLNELPMIGLAKRFEDIVLLKDSGFEVLTLPADSPLVMLLQRIRDESHRFAVAYHTTLKRGRVVSSLLDEIPGIGAVTRKKLIRDFGSTKGVIRAGQAELEHSLGPKRGQQLYRYLANYR